MIKFQMIELFKNRITELYEVVSRMRTWNKFGENRILNERIKFVEKTIEQNKRLLEQFFIGVVHV